MNVVTFSANGEYLVGCHYCMVRVWRAEDGREMAAWEVKNVEHLAVSNDGSWIAGGTVWWDVFVWDANTYKQRYAWKDLGFINGLDFSPDSTRLVAATYNNIATIWDVATGKPAHRLHHEDSVRAAKYSQRGDRIATVTNKSARIWDSEDGRLLTDVPVDCTSLIDVFWFYNHIFVATKNAIKKIERSTVSQ